MSTTNPKLLAVLAACALVIDISVAQGEVDLHAAAAWRDTDGKRIEAVIVKCDEGNAAYADPQFVRSWAGALVAGFIRGAYHFAHPDDVHVLDAEDEAHRFAARLKANGFRPGIDFCALDIEEASRISKGPRFVEWVLTFCETVDRDLEIGDHSTGPRRARECGIYTGGPFFDEHDGDPSPDTIARLRARWLWLAAYVGDPEKFIPPEWREGEGWEGWQATGDFAGPGFTLLHVAGIGGGRVNVDRSYFKGDLAAWIAGELRDTSPPTDRTLPPEGGGLMLGDGQGNPLGREDRAESDLAAVEFAQGTPTRPETPRTKSGKIAAVNPDDTWPSDGAAPSSNPKG